MTNEDRSYFQRLMDDVHEQFMAAVEHERNLDHDVVVGLADGRVFTGKEAMELHLVDTLGTYEDAVTIAAAIANIKGRPALVKERKRVLSIFDSMFGQSKVSEIISLKDELLNQPILQYKMMHGF